jgi:deoxyribonuclease V
VILALDVQYGAAFTQAAAVGFEAWSSSSPCLETTARREGAAAPYEPGAFWKRELPVLLALLGEIRAPRSVLVIDGYCTLGRRHLGLGAHLHAATGTPVVGVAKTRFAGADAVEVRRGGSTQPLYITASGMNESCAADAIRSMHGPYRLPTLLKHADTLTRTT